MTFRLVKLLDVFSLVKLADDLTIANAGHDPATAVVLQIWDAQDFDSLPLDLTVEPLFEGFDFPSEIAGTARIHLVAVF